MRAAPLALIVFAGFACRRGALQEDAGGIGTIGLDASPSGAGGGAANRGGDGGPGGGDGAGPPDVRLPTADANCGQTGIKGARLSPEILVVLDRAIAIAPDRWNSFLTNVAAMIGRNASSVDWGLYAFPTNGATCATSNLGSAIDVIPAPDDATHVIAHLLAAGSVTGGSPTAAAIDVAATYMLSRTTESPRFLMLVTDGAPTCAGRTGTPSADAAQALADAVAAITEAKAAGVPTFVVAPSTAAMTEGSALNALAVAGGYAQAGDVKFATEATISTWFQTTDNEAGCTIWLSMQPPVPDVVSVMLNGVSVPRDRAHQAGWDYTDATATSVHLYGAWCDMVHTARSYQIDVYYGCPNPG